MNYTSKLLLITPPFTQLNTPYPATMYLKGFLNTKGIESYQADLGIEVILDLFSKKGLQSVFDIAEKSDREVSPNIFRIHNLREDYTQTIDPLILFLQNKNPTLAHSICDRTFLPEASRFEHLEDLDWAFGAMGIQDRARHLATLYLEDLGDLIKELIDPYFGFSRYAERLGRTASSFDDLAIQLNSPNTLITDMLWQRLEEKIQLSKPNVICLSVPFPGNLFAAFKCAQYIKLHHPAIKVVMGGGYANTELRSVSDPRVFDYLDFICLDDGEAPLLNLLAFIEGKKSSHDLLRTFARIDGVVQYFNDSLEKDIPQKDTGTPDYSDLPLNDYLSVIEVANPMHRMWSDGRWNKLTLAHGCYWGKCTFCDISLHYIKHYEPLTASLICDRMEEIIAQTGQTGFHFVDEAAPPNLLKAVALEILRRKLVVSWWTNIRFEKHFTPDLAKLLKASGCIAVAGGLEVASDRLLKLMKKGVTVSQVAQVADGFTQAGILVHAYLMYGFPTETEQETIDALEMVRQLFEQGVIQSGFWHLFAMTAHSPVGLNPAEYDVIETGPKFKGFAENDLFHDDPKGADHEQISAGLRKSLFNFMHGVGLDFPLKEWFEFKTPKTSISPHFIASCLEGREEKFKPNQSIVWLGNMPHFEVISEHKNEVAAFEFFDKKLDWVLHCEVEVGIWLMDVFPQCLITAPKVLLFSEFKEAYEQKFSLNFEDFLKSELIHRLRENGLLII